MSDDDHWWREAVVYEVYLRSFADADGDGTGDLEGLTSRLEHLTALGVDAVWLTPFYPSPGHDHGYDVADYRDVDPLFGDLDAFDRLVERAHDLGLRVVIDLVPNHTSDQHPWFRAAVADPTAPHRGYYIWRPPAGDGGPPNNWQSNFGGPAWTPDPASGEYYLHLFLPEQPDLNWRDERVQDEFDAILDFWLARGVDGFRIDVAHALLKHPELPDNPELPTDEVTAARHPVVGRVAAARRLARVHDVDQDDVVDVFRRWRAGLRQRHPGRHVWLLGETVVERADRLGRYVAESAGLDSAMWFGAIQSHLDADELLQVLRAADGLGRDHGTLAWFLSNHDRSRPATRFGGGRDGAQRALAVAALLMAMPGPYLIYQGEELGGEDVEVDPGRVRDPIAARAGELASGRDRSRGPIAWSRGPGGGFSCAEPWLPLTPAAAGPVDEQRRAPDSPLVAWSALISAWRTVRDRLADTPVDVVTADGRLEVRRGRLTAVLVTGAEPVEVRGALWRSDGGRDGPLGPWQAAWCWAEGTR